MWPRAVIQLGIKRENTLITGSDPELEFLKSIRQYFSHFLRKKIFNLNKRTCFPLVELLKQPGRIKDKGEKTGVIVQIPLHIKCLKRYVNSSHYKTPQ